MIYVLEATMKLLILKGWQIEQMKNDLGVKFWAIRGIKQTFKTKEHAIAHVHWHLESK